jgi:hypothetical protein
MSLTSVEKVRFGIGDITLPYILSDSQITNYLSSNSDSISDTIDELQPIMLAAIAARGGSYRTENLWEDTTKQAASYSKSLDKINKLKASSAYPIIGGVSSESGALSVSVDMFDEENDYHEDDTFLNSIEDI